MPVNLNPPNAADLFAIPGVRLGVAQAGVRKAQRDDVTVFLFDDTVSVAGVFTQNKFCAAPVQICRQRLASQPFNVRALVVNTGNANAGTGADGLKRGHLTCDGLANLLGVDAAQILPFSTGVIMEPLPFEKIVAALPSALADAKENNWFRAAHAIMTTDTQAKAYSQKIVFRGTPVHITGMSKGAGMIRPNMATMLGFIATDARIDACLMQTLVQEVANQSFNRVTIDGDTSTNDSFILIATNKAEHAPITELTSDEVLVFKRALLDVAQKLAQAIVRDGEGATKFITIQVEGGRTEAECKLVAYAIAHSPLVKTAFFASDPNLGRILAAVGYAGIEDLDQSCIDLYLDDVHVVTQGGRHADYQEEAGQRVMRQNEITVRVGLGRGAAEQTVWTCDLSHDYVTINADYRS